MLTRVVRFHRGISSQTVKAADSCRVNKMELNEDDQVVSCFVKFLTARRPRHAYRTHIRNGEESLDGAQGTRSSEGFIHPWMGFGSKDFIVGDLVGNPRLITVSH